MSTALDRAEEACHAERKAGLGLFGSLLVAAFVHDSEAAEPGSVEEKIGVWADAGRSALDDCRCGPRTVEPCDVCAEEEEARDWWSCGACGASQSDPFGTVCSACGQAHDR